MLSIRSLLLIALSGAVVRATNTAGDPTNLANWPPCAQACIPIGLAPPVSCQSLSNLTCVCQNPAFAVSIAGCEKMKCSMEDVNQIQELSTPLCAPVGGLAPAVDSSIASYLATASLTASGVPTSLPAGATAGTAVSAALSSVTFTPNLGNPADISNYPLCAQVCNNETMTGVGCDLNDITCLCGPTNRAKTSACQEVTCSAGDILTTSLLAQELCGPVYSESPAIGSSVSSAIAAATAAAAAAVASKDPTNIASLPPCAQSCLKQALPLSGCGSLSNRQCVCKSAIFNANVGPCEQTTCNPTDLQIITDLAYELCAPVGGIGNASNATSYTANATTVASPSPSPSQFTGDAAFHRFGWALGASLAVVWGVSVALLL